MTSFRVDVADGCVTVEADGFSLEDVGRALITLGEFWDAPKKREPVVVQVAPVKKPEPVVAAPLPPPVKPAAHPCDVCGYIAPSQRGLSIHKGRSHKADAKPDAKPAEVRELHPVAESNGNGNGHRDGERLFCDECKFTADRLDFAKLRSHTMSQHDGRLPSTLERTPRTPAERAR